MRERTPRRSRTRTLVLGLVGGLAALVVVGGTAVAVVWSTADVDTTGQVDFAQPLRVPPLADSRVEDGVRVFDLTMQAGSTDFGLGAASSTWGVNGDFLGPTLRAARGERIRVDVTNELDETSSLHWHGHHLPAAMDGGPHQPVEPGETWSPHWRVDQPAATTWYHPHPHGATADHVLRGLAGMSLLDDPEAGPLGLPHEYGVDDIPVIVQDRSFDDDGELDGVAGRLGSTGYLGDTVLVNGTVGPYLDVTTERVRLRLLNASNARVYDFRLDDGRPLTMVGTDGGLLPAPHETEHVQLSPGERAEVVVTMRPGETAVLRSEPPALGADTFTARLAGGDDRFDVLELRAAESLAPSPEPVDVLAEEPRLDEVEPAATRSFSLSGTRINGLDMDMARIDEVVTVDTTEVWQVGNDDGTPHSFHVHDVQFQVLDVDGHRPPPELSGWKDTVYVPPGGEVRLAVRFTDYTDPDRPYMFHCHLLRHEDQGMMGQVVVVEPGG